MRLGPVISWRGHIHDSLLLHFNITILVAGKKVPKVNLLMDGFFVESRRV